MTYEQAIHALNAAAKAAVSASLDTTMHPCIDRQALRLISAETDRLVEQGPDSGLSESKIMPYLEDAQ